MNAAISQKPLPTWRELFAASGPMVEPFSSASIFYTMNGRNAIYHALSALGIQPGDVVLLPAYHCTAMVDPVLAFGARVSFYSVHKDLTLDLDELDVLAAAGAKALLFVHFFGRPAPAAALRELADSYSMALIEDGTHTLAGLADGKAIGSWGDAAIFSPRKLLSLPDGGLLLLRNKFVETFGLKLTSPFLYHLRTAKLFFESFRLGEMNPGHVQTDGGRWIGSAPQRAGAPGRRGPASQDDPEFEKRWLTWSMSSISRRLFDRTNPAAVRQARIRRYQQLETFFAAFVIAPTLPPVRTVQFTPLGYPIISKEHKRLDYALRRRGIPAFSFGEVLHNELPIENFPDAAFLADHTTLLPVHQRLTDEQMQRMISILEEYFQSTSPSAPAENKPEPEFAK